MVRLPLYHVTTKRNRGAIRRYGLLARSTGDYNYPNYPGQPRGVYGTNVMRVLFHHGCDLDEDHRDIWRIDAAGLPLELDPVLGRIWSPGQGEGAAYVVLCDVPPDRLTLAATVDCWNVAYPDPREEPTL